LNLGFTHRPPVAASGERPTSDAISFDEWRARNRGSRGPLVDAFNRQEQLGQNMNDHLLNTVVASDLSNDERMEVESIIRDYNQGGFSLTDSDLAEAGPSGVNTSEATPSSTTESSSPEEMSARKRPRIEATTAGPAQTSAATAETGHNSSSDGGFDSAQGPLSTLPKGGYRVSPGRMQFKKNHQMNTWAIPNWVVGHNSRGGANFITTPMAVIPVKKACFYLSPEEFNLIPAGSYIESVHVRVTQITATTGYPTGGTESSIATTNHPKILMVGHDLEGKIRAGTNRRYNITSTMIPSNKTNGAAQFFIDDFIEKQYGTDQTAADAAVVVPGVGHRIPYYTDCYFSVYQPNAAQAVARGFTSATAPGFEYFQNAVEYHNSNDHTWDNVVDYHYKFVNAPIGERFKHLEIFTDDVTQAVGSGENYNMLRNITNIKPNGDLTMTESITPSTFSSAPIVTYKSADMEKGCHFVKGDGTSVPARQPSLHVGLKAIEKVLPESGTARASEFVQANIGFNIEATMNIILPKYPNRFIRPKFYNTSVERAVAGIGYYPESGNDPTVTFNLYNSVEEAPAVAAVDQTEDAQPTEGNQAVDPALPRALRPKRSVPAVAITKKKAPKK
jgi:hypothetical protein